MGFYTSLTLIYRDIKVREYLLALFVKKIVIK